jgi:hypothetical protein
VLDHRQGSEDQPTLESRAEARRAPLASLLALLALWVALALAACSGGDEAATSPAATSPADTVSQAAAAGRKVEIVAPADGAAVQAPVTLEVRVSGFELVEPDGDTSGATGHLHAFVDRKRLPPPGEIIPEQPGTADFWTGTVTLEGLASGRHTITVVATDGYRVPFGPPVWDRVRVSVH